MTPECYSKLLNRYEKAHGFPFLVCDGMGKVVHGESPATACSCKGLSEAQRIEAARQTVSFGEPIIGLCCENGFGQWAVPLMQNAELTGALVVQGIDLESGEENFSRHVRSAAQGLLKLAIEENLTNAAAL